MTEVVELRLRLILS